MLSSFARRLCMGGAITAFIAAGALAEEPTGAWWNQPAQIHSLTLEPEQRANMESHLRAFARANRSERSTADAAAAALYTALATADTTATEVATARLARIAAEALARQATMVAAVLQELDPGQHNLLLGNHPNVLPRFWNNTAPKYLLSPPLVAAGPELMARPAALDPAQTRRSESGHFTVTYGAANRAALNRDQEWTLTLVDAGGQPVSGAEVHFVATMPEHGHGMSTTAEVTPTDEAGQYRVAGVRFHMPGWWRATVAIVADGRRDLVEFDLAVGEP